MSRVYFRGNREQAKAVARRLKDILIGRAADPNRLAEGVFHAIGFAALSDIKDDYVRKAEGGTGEDGNTWPDLSPATKAYGRRFGKGEEAKLKKTVGLGKAHRYAPGNDKGLLTKQQLKAWNAIFAAMLSRFLVSMPEGEAKARAAQVAWARLKQMGARTKIDVYGKRQLQILRDTGVLLNSLSPGRLENNGSYSKPTVEGGEEQIFDTISNGIIVGTNVIYAATHNEGDPARGIPARPFLPKEPPQVWQDRWANVAEQAVAVATVLAFEGAA